MYIQANKKQRNEIETIYNKIIKLIKDGNSLNYNIILMGNFNARYDDFINKNKKYTNNSWINKIFRKLEQQNMIKTTSLIHDISTQNPFYTFKRGDNNS